MKFFRLILSVFILMLVSQACSIAGKRASSSNILFIDDFSTTKNKWDQVSDSTHITDYFDHAYQIGLNQVDSQIWSNPKGESFTNTQIEVDATKNGGPDDNFFGIICRYSASNSFYYGVISNDGYYAISKMSIAGGKQIDHDKMLQSDKIATGPAINHIRFDCVGSTLTLYANGYQIAQATDIEFTKGNVGLIAGTFKDPGTDILFDNFIVYKPNP